MLTLVIALVLGQAAPVPPRIKVTPPDARIERLDIARPDGTRVVVRSDRCPPLLHQISPVPGGAQTPPEDGRVRLYRLLDRRIGGCSVPLVAVDHLPDADRAIEINRLRR